MIAMLFNSYEFVLLFLPITVLLYYLAGKINNIVQPKYVLLAASFVFIAYANFYFLILLLVSICVNFLCNYMIKVNPSTAKRTLFLGVIFNILFLGFFKYTNFLIDSVNLAFGASITAVKVILPLGISFYTFQQIAYLVDHYRGEAPTYSFIDYVLFIAYFPKVIQGPITYHDEVIPQLNNLEKRKIDFNNLSAGLMTFAIGMAKKVLIADNFGKVVDYGFGTIASLNSFEAVLVILGYTLQIYFDFSGYTDMAIGISRMLNIDLPLNFNSPYKARNINDFWKRWHITLTRFLTKYIYIPLGGNRKGTARTYINIMIVFIISGIWHGAGYTFIVWGALHGIASVLYRLTKKSFDAFPRMIQWAATFLFVSIAWTFFRAGSLSEAVSLFGRVFAGGFGVNAELAETMLQPALINIPAQFIPFHVVMILLYIGLIAVVSLLKNSNDMTKEYRPGFSSWLFSLILLTLSILSISGVSSFLYSNF